MRSELLSPEEINLINKQLLDPLLHIPSVVMRSGTQRHDIIKVTPNKKLIFIKGDLNTGFEHIHFRHSFSSKEYSKCGINKFMKTSKFSSLESFFPDYMNLAEFLYDPNFISNDNNKQKDLFDVYENDYTFSYTKKYRLILYKDTRIIHTLFPLEKRKPSHKYLRGKLIISKESTDNIIFVKVPYYNFEGRCKYALYVRFILTDSKEIWQIVSVEDSTITAIKDVGFKEFDKSDLNYINKRIKEIEMKELDSIEKIIKQIDKEKKAQ